jgi:hypothetical protein
MIGECFGRRGDALNLGQDLFSEEGRGLGFSVGGWHPFRANTYLPTLKKLDPLSHTSIGKAFWKPIEKVNQSVNKDFAKGKKWSQDHRKQLQIAAAVALAAVGGAYALGYLGTAGTGAAGSAAASEAAAATAAAEGGATVTATTAFVPETLTAIGTGTSASSAAAAGGLSLVPATVGTAAPVASAFAPILTAAAPSAAPAAAGGLFSGALGTTAQTVGILGALSKLAGGQAQPAADPNAGYSGGGFGGGWGSAGGSGGGGGLGPMGPMGPPESLAPAAVPDAIPSWALPAAGAALLLLLLKR